MLARIGRAALAGDVLDVAPFLLGAVVVHESPSGRVAVRLTEVEAYAGPDDPGSHAFRGRTPRAAVMFGPPGHLYVYFAYGMHWCANVVCGPEGQASAVLLRGGEVVEGAGPARARRPSARTDVELARGPARLASALGLHRDHNGADLSDPAATVWLEQASVGAARATGGAARAPVRCGPRVGVSGPGGDGERFPWRFWLEGEPSVSVYRPAAPRRPRYPGDGRLAGTLIPGRRAGRNERTDRP
ncbi:MAG: DNA-3-methyladenine glycosylase [Actinomycetota bacterium]|nr:DNA-3-methyladenine glycosylase [Actinomycetota bacterium]